MSIIKILDKDVANIIAAGQVVSDPASLVKELVENSLDAKANSIIIEILEGGREVKVLDNGIGMDEEDLKICIEKHATSKFFKKEDLLNIRTYGFRGEALSSISNVSKTEISSRKKDTIEGLKIEIAEGKIVNEKKISMNVGTEITIKDLFYNIPMKLKCLKRADIEYYKIKSVILREALINWNVSFTLKINGKTAIQTSGVSLENAIIELLGRNVLKSLVKFEYGYLGNINLVKNNRNYMLTYFNKRYAREVSVDRAVIDAYYTKIPKGKFPFVILDLDIDYSLIDVNIHPSKEAVKLIGELEVYEKVRGAIENCISSNEREIIKTFIDPYSKVNVPRVSSNTSYSSNEFKSPQRLIPQKNVNQIEDYFIKNKYIAQIYKTYIIVECKDKIELYDQHIVHERILYEDLKQKVEKKALESQALLVPIKIELDHLEKDVSLQNIELFKSLGFFIEDFGKKDIVVRAVPSFKIRESIENILRALISDIMNSDVKDIREKTIITIACKSAIKAGDSVEEYDMKKMINKLHEIKIYTCPHGRNIITDLPLDYLEKQFKRR